MNPILFKSCTILFLCISVYAKPEEAFIFDRVHHVVFNMSDTIGENEKCGAVATACPMEELQEASKKQFLETCSITNNALIVKQTYPRDGPANKVEKYICKQPFKISLVYNVVKRVFEFGFEVFYSADLDHEFESSNYRNYIPFKEAMEMLASKSNMIKFYGKNLLSRAQDLLPGSTNSRTKWYDANNKMIFVWINMFRMKYNSSKMIVRNVTYEIRRNTKELVPLKCKDDQNTLGSEAYTGIEGTVESLYANQAKIFEELKVPSITPPCEGDSCPVPVPNPCEANNDCFDKWSLIPTDQFHLFRSTPLLCSNLITIPIWKDATKGVLEKLDRYIYALFKFLGEKRLHVLAGVSSTQLMLPLKGKSKSSKKGPVYLDPENKKIPAPEFIFKLVKYYPRACDPKDKTCEYAVMFIVHNDPNFKSSDKICSEKVDFTTDWGWSAITKDISGKQYKNIYACPNNKEVLKKIYSYKAFLTSTPNPTSKNLNLKQFPVYDAETATINENNNIEEEVDKMHEDLATHGENLEFKDVITWYQENNENVEDIDEDFEESDSPKSGSPRK